MPTVTPSSAVDPISEPFGLESLFGPFRKGVETYSEGTQQEARRSFNTSWRVMFAGFVWLIVWSLGPVFLAHNSDVRWAAASLAAFGAGLSAYITRTFLSLHGRCLEQQTYYYRQLLATYFLLQAERLANVTPEKKGELYVEIVRALIRGAEQVLPETLAREPSPRQKSRGDPGAGPAVPQGS